MRSGGLNFVCDGTVRWIWSAGFGDPPEVGGMWAIILVIEVGDVDGLPTISRIKGVSASQ